MISNVETGVLLNIFIETWIKQNLFEIEIHATNAFNFV